MKKRYVELILANVLYGLAFPLTVIALRGLTPIYLAAFRSLWLFLTFIPYARKRITDLKLLFAIALSRMVLPMILQNVGMLYTSASFASIIQSSFPILVVPLAYLALKERITKRKILGVFMGFFGAFLVLFEGSGGIFFGNFLVLLSAVSIAFLSILEKIALSKHSPYEIIAVSSLMSFPVLLPIAIISEGFYLPSLTSIACTLVLSFCCTILPYFLWLDGLKEMEISRAALFSYMMPVFGVIFSVLLLAESISVLSVLGMVVISISIWIVQ